MRQPASSGNAKQKGENYPHLLKFLISISSDDCCEDGFEDIALLHCNKTFAEFLVGVSDSLGTSIIKIITIVATMIKIIAIVTIMIIDRPDHHNRRYHDHPDHHNFP